MVHIVIVAVGVMINKTAENSKVKVDKPKPKTLGKSSKKVKYSNVLQNAEIQQKEALIGDKQMSNTINEPDTPLQVIDRILLKLLVATNEAPGKDFPLDVKDMIVLCHTVREIFMNEETLLRIEAPMTICGDIHGQFPDLLRIFENEGDPSKTRYLFLGDYVDRGKNSIETICLLFALKVRFSNNIFLLRGNHECANLTQQYGFYDECKRRYNVKLWKTFIDTFNCLPIAAVVSDRMFCVHGGLSPDMKTVSDINKIIRPTLIPDEGLLCDLLWSDPDAESDGIGWQENERGVSFTFGCDVIEQFLQINNLDIIVRAHEVVEDGYLFACKRRLVTIFSAPSYTGTMNNKGAVLQVDETLKCNIRSLECKQKVNEDDYD